MQCSWNESKQITLLDFMLDNNIIVQTVVSFLLGIAKFLFVFCVLIALHVAFIYLAIFLRIS